MSLFTVDYDNVRAYAFNVSRLFLFITSTKHAVTLHPTSIKIPIWKRLLSLLKHSLEETGGWGVQGIRTLPHRTFPLDSGVANYGTLGHTPPRQSLKRN